jgi:SAM-dependent methyltransferase
VSLNAATFRAAHADARRFYEAGDEKRWGRESIPDLEKEVLGWLRAARLGRQALVVELGCGRGAFRNLSRLFNYVGLDICFEVLSRHIGPPCALQADVENLPLASGSADFVLSISTLEHVPSPDRALAEIDRILRPGAMAFLAPAWFCRPWAAKGLPIRSYFQLSFADKVHKALIPLRNNLAWRAAFVLPRRVFRELCSVLSPNTWSFRYGRLEPNLSSYVYTDCDAFCSLDPHEAVLLFSRWGYAVPSAPSFLSRVLLRHVPVVLRKPH